MKESFKSTIGWYRVLGFIDGISLLILVFVALPLNRIWHQPELTKILGPIHGGIFILFAIFSIYMALKYQWSWKREVVLVTASCFVPFVTFYLDLKILKPLHESNP